MPCHAMMLMPGDGPHFAVPSHFLLLARVTLAPTRICISIICCRTVFSSKVAIQYKVWQFDKRPDFGTFFSPSGSLKTNIRFSITGNTIPYI